MLDYKHFICIFLAIITVDNSRSKSIDDINYPSGPDSASAIVTLNSATATNPLERLNALILNAENTIKNASQQLEQYRKENNYFELSLEKEITALQKYTEHLRKEYNDVQSMNPFLLELSRKYEIKVAKIVSRIHDLYLLGEHGTDPTYVDLFHMMDALKMRALADIGGLYVHGKVNNADAIRNEILQIEQLEQQLKSINFVATPENAKRVVDQMLEHERRLNEELFKLENDDL